MSDNPPLTAGRLMKIAKEQYEEFYENPRRIHYFEIRDLVAFDNVRVLDYVAEAIDLGCVDSKQGRDKRSEEELFENIGEPWDDQWDLVEEDNE